MSRPRKAAAKTNGKAPSKKARLIAFGPEIEPRIEALCRKVPKLSGAEVIRTAVEEYLDRIDADPNILEVMCNPRLRSPTFIAALLHGKLAPMPISTVAGNSDHERNATQRVEFEDTAATPVPATSVASRRTRRADDGFAVLPRPGYRPPVDPKDFEASKEGDSKLMADIAQPPELTPPPEAPPFEAPPEEVPVG